LLIFVGIFLFFSLGGGGLAVVASEVPDYKTFVRLANKDAWKFSLAAVLKDKKHAKWLDDKKYESSIWEYIKNELADNAVKLECNVNEVVCFKRDFSFAAYNGSNWNAFIVKNCINRALSKETSEKKLGDALIDETAAFLKSQSRAYISDKESIVEKCADFGEQIDAAVRDIKIYARDLELYDYLKRLKELRTETYLEALTENQKFQRIQGELQAAKAFAEKFGDYEGNIAPDTAMVFRFDEKSKQIRGALYLPSIRCAGKSGSYYDISRALRNGKLSDFYMGDVVPGKELDKDDYESQVNKIFYFDDKVKLTKAKDLPKETVDEFLAKVEKTMKKDFWKGQNEIKSINMKQKLPSHFIADVLAECSEPPSLLYV
jgi:hypothetical protein